jgi:hypothetical protein
MESLAGTAPYVDFKLRMAISDISWTVGIGWWTLAAGSGVPLMLDRRHTCHQAAKFLYWFAPLGPIIAAFVWIVADRPPWLQCLVVSGGLGAVTGVTLLELLRWIDVHEGRDNHTME